MTDSPADNDAFRIVLASLPDRDAVVAEIWIGEHMFGELRREAGAERLSIFGDPTAMGWDLPVEHVLAAIAAARRRLHGERDG